MNKKISQTANDNRCVLCDESIPEGRMVCPTCEEKYCSREFQAIINEDDKKINENKKERKSIMKIIGKNLVVFYLLSFTWGLIASLAGFIVLIPFIFIRRVHVNHGRFFVVLPEPFGHGFGFAAGCFFFVAHNGYKHEYLYAHEMGHGLQNCVFGPLTIFMIYIPSLIRYWYREIHFYNKGICPPTAYDDIWFEHQATVWGHKYIFEEEDVCDHKES